VAKKPVLTNFIRIQTLPYKQSRGITEKEL